MRKATRIFLIITLFYISTGFTLLIAEQNIKQFVLKDSIVFHHHGNSEEFEDEFFLDQDSENFFVFYAHGVSDELLAHVSYYFDDGLIYEKNITESPRHSGGSLSLEEYVFKVNVSGMCRVSISVEKSDRWHLTVYQDPSMDQLRFFEEDGYLVMMILLTLIGGFFFLMVGLFIEMSKT